MKSPSESDDLSTPVGEELRAAAREVESATSRAEEARRTATALSRLVDTLLEDDRRVLVLLDADLRVVGWSGGTERRLGRVAADALGRTWAGLRADMGAPAVHPAEVAEVDPEGEISLEGGWAARAVVGDEGIEYLVLVGPPEQE